MNEEDIQSAQKITAFDCNEKKHELENLATKILNNISNKGAFTAQISMGLTQGVSLEVRKQQIETLEFNCDKGLTITVFEGLKKGHASTTDFSEEGLERTIEAALSIAHYAAEDPCAGLADKELLATEFKELELYHPWETSIDEMISLALKTEKATLEFDDRISNTDGCSISTYEGLSLLSNSQGFMGFKKGTRHSLSTVAIASDDSGMQRDYYYSSNRDAKLLEAGEAIGVKAASRTVAKLNAGTPESGKWPVIFSPEMARSLFGHFLSAIQGGQIYRKSSFLVDAIGRDIFPSWLSLKEEPHIINGHASKTFDAEGVATHPKYFVENGVLSQYLLSSYSARRLSMKTTGNAGGISNVRISHQEMDQKELIQSVSKGLLVTELMGQGVNMVTGDYSRGASGFWIENGKIQYPVRGVTIAGNLSNIFAGITQIGNDIDTRSALYTGSVLVDEMTVAN